MISRLIRILLLVSSFFSAHAQRLCGNDARLNPVIKDRVIHLQSAIERGTHFFPKLSGIKTTTGILRIPVVVHIIHDNPTSTIGGINNSNISDEQVFSQIQVLNNDYRRKNGTLGFNNNPVGADMEIEFYLATIDPEGKPTNGIIRRFSEKYSYDVLEDIPELSALSYWDSNRYLNIWVTRLQDNFIGYGEMPTASIDGLDTPEIEASVDGVVIDHSVFGNKVGTANKGAYAFGRTLTHEVGHWLGLLHTWGDEFCGTDYCDDTPPTEEANNTLFCTPIYSICFGVETRNQIENFLDYSPDSCMNLFTQDQKNRVYQVLQLSARRARLVAFAQNLQNFSSTNQLRLINHPSNDASLQIQVLLADFQDFTLQIYDMLGREVFAQTFKDSPSRLLNVHELFTQKGVFLVRLTTTAGQQTKRMAVL